MTDTSSKFNELKDKLTKLTGSPGLTSFSEGKVSMTLGEWERLICFIGSAHPGLNPDALHQLFAVAMMEVLDAEKLMPGKRLVHVNDMQEVLNRLEKKVLAVAQPVDMPGTYTMGTEDEAQRSHDRRLAMKTRDTMSIQEILKVHEFAVDVDYETAKCACGLWKYSDCIGNVEAHRAHVAEVLEQHMQEREQQMRQLIRDMVDPDQCWFDHHGGCQAHGYLSLEPGELCPHMEAKRLLEEADTTSEKDQ